MSRKIGQCRSQKVPLKGGGSWFWCCVGLLVWHVLKSNRNYEAPPTHVSKKPLSLRQENSRAGAAETRRELKKDPTEVNNTYSVAKKKERTISDSSQRAKLHVSNKSSSLSGQFTDIKKVGGPLVLPMLSMCSRLKAPQLPCLALPAILLWGAR